jgi:hypothetical protein
MPNRILREGILTSERINSLKPQAELFFRRLMSVVDDFGRYSANPALLRAHCYPLKLDEVREADISRWLTEVESAGLIALYAVETKRYLEVLDFRQQVRAKDSRYPHPNSERIADAMQASGTSPAGEKPLQANAHLDEDEDEDEDEDGVVDEGGAGRVTAPRRKSSYLLDEEFWAQMRRHYPDIDVEAESRKMDAWLLTRPGRKKTRQFCVNWLNKAEPALAAAKPKERDLSWS